MFTVINKKSKKRVIVYAVKEDETGKIFFMIFNVSEGKGWIWTEADKYMSENAYYKLRNEQLMSSPDDMACSDGEEVEGNTVSDE